MVVKVSRRSFIALGLSLHLDVEDRATESVLDRGCGEVEVKCGFDEEESTESRVCVGGRPLGPPDVGKSEWSPLSQAVEEYPSSAISGLVKTLEITAE